MAIASSTGDSALPDGKRPDRTTLWDDGADAIRALEDLRDDYDAFIRLEEDASDTTFTSGEARRYRGSALRRIGRIAGDGSGPSRGTLDAELDLAYHAALDFAGADPAVRERYRDRDRDRYEALVGASPNRIHLDDEHLLSEFSQEGGTLYKLTVGVMRKGADVLDSWVESSEERLEAVTADPATTPEDRADQADRMYQ